MAQTDEDGDTYMPPVLVMRTSKHKSAGKETLCRTWHQIMSAIDSDQNVR
jgi:hypothetical protein